MRWFEAAAAGTHSWMIPSRRELLQLSGLGALNLFWSDWMRASAAGTPRPAGKARSVILIFNAGAPSHIDLWDMKPDAPQNIRGEFGPIQTNVPGIQISELMPRLARRAHQLAIVRSLHHRHGGHNAGMYWSIVGRPYRRDDTLINPSRTDYPSFGTLVGWLAQRDGYSSPLPPYVITPSPHCDSTVYITPGQFGGCLGARYDPFVLNADPNAANFRVPNIGLAADMSEERFQGRRVLLDSVAASAGSQLADSEAVRKGVRPLVQAGVNFSRAKIRGSDPFSDSLPERDYQINHARAFTLVSSRQVQRAFDLSQEPERVRERYGRHTWGQSHLLARRLVEAGVPFVTTVNGSSIVWDTHGDNFNRLKTTLVPPMECAFAALLEDLEDRGLLDSTLVVWMGDFGRTPTINRSAGRDHWPQCYSMILAGGGIRGGQVVGQSDRIGAYPRHQPITPADIHATVFTALGYNPHAIFYTSPEGRPFPLTEGETIRQLLT